MAIYQTVDLKEFKQAFANANRKDFGEALGLLYNHLLVTSEENGEDIELDPVELCTQFTAYSLAEYAKEHIPDEYLEDLEQGSQEWTESVLEFARDYDNYASHDDSFILISA